ncbi:hypothetical protein L0U88_16065 [Flavihumibacter sp. RY-1]|uniref:Uncharacterized protein n=1 Tax=Flavihumibacter fluminis TaxID=2909236 RepID=A0ABS9BKC5_9BACT|nr:hypothetical protein [Flavihumibacter fluminis]MCF1716157.1 hypothetical protein [Flavihumibacter fluminis]
MEHNHVYGESANSFSWDGIFSLNIEKASLEYKVKESEIEIPIFEKKHSKINHHNFFVFPIGNQSEQHYDKKPVYKKYESG